MKNAEGKEAVWTIDLKSTGSVYKGEPKTKPNVTIILSDETFTQLAQGKLDGQKAFMSGKLKTKGNMMFATKLDGILKVRNARIRRGIVLTHVRCRPRSQRPSCNTTSPVLSSLSTLWYHHCISGIPTIVLHINQPACCAGAAYKNFSSTINSSSLLLADGAATSRS